MFLASTVICANYILLKCFMMCLSAVYLLCVCPLQVFAPWDGKPEPGVIAKLFKNGMVKIKWSDGTKATKVDAIKIDASNAAAAKKAAEEAATRGVQEEEEGDVQEK